MKSARAGVHLAGRPWFCAGLVVAVGAGLTLTAIALPSTVQASVQPASGTTGAATQRVTLPTGEQVVMSGPASNPAIGVPDSGVDRTSPALITYTTGSASYVMPISAQPYIGHSLDVSLFDVRRIATSQHSGGRLPVRISYSGHAPSIPGVRLTAAASGVATGYLTPTSATAFGQALTAAWKADEAEGTTPASTLFRGINRIESALPGPQTFAPHYPMVTLKLKVIDTKGKPLSNGLVQIANVDTGYKKYSDVAVIEKGIARVSVPKGHYSAADLLASYSQKTGISTLTFSAVTDFEVTRTGQTMRMDFREATARPAVSVPRETKSTAPATLWDRRAADGTPAMKTGVMAFSDSADLRLSAVPSQPAKVGRQYQTYFWNLESPNSANVYRYSLAAVSDHVDASPTYTFTAGNLATVRSTYYDDQWKATPSLLRFPTFRESDFAGGPYVETNLHGSQQTEYVGAIGGTPVWTDLLKADGGTDGAFDMTGQARELPAGSSSTLSWMRGPLAPGIVTTDQRRGSMMGGLPAVCPVCRTSKSITLQLSPLLDDADHTGLFYQGDVSSRFRLYENGKQVADKKNTRTLTHAVPTGRTTYKAVFDLNRAAQKPRLSSTSRTEYTFVSANGQGGKLPSGWKCPLGNQGSGVKPLCPV